MEAYIAEYLEYLRTKKHRSANTLAAYKQDLLRFALFLQNSGICRLDKITETSCSLFLLALEGEGKSPASVQRKLTALRSFFDFLIRRGYMKEDPTELLPSIRSEDPSCGKRVHSAFCGGPKKAAGTAGSGIGERKAGLCAPSSACLCRTAALRAGFPAASGSFSEKRAFDRALGEQGAEYPSDAGDGRGAGRLSFPAPRRGGGGFCFPQRGGDEPPGCLEAGARVRGARRAAGAEPAAAQKTVRRKQTC